MKLLGNNDLQVAHFDFSLGRRYVDDSIIIKIFHRRYFYERIARSSVIRYI